MRILSECLDILKDSVAIRDQAITDLQSRVTQCSGEVPETIYLILEEGFDDFEKWCLMSLRASF